MSDPRRARRPDLGHEDAGKTTDRRAFIAAAGAGIFAAACATLAGRSVACAERLLATRFAELSPSEVERRLAELERSLSARHGAAIRVAADPPIDGVQFGYGLDLSRCIGCRRCVYACVHENNQSRNPQVQWIRVLAIEEEKGIDLLESDPYYDPETVPEEDRFYLPVACQQCRRPPCTKVCPVRATWQEDDGIVVIDYDWCIGCRCCMSACPYGARRFNWSEPTLPSGVVNPDTHILGNRPRPRGVVEKCTFCVQRVRRGRYPACVEICPVGARKFGDLLDEEGEMRYLLREKRVFVLKEELNTQPKFFYFYAT